VNLNTSKGATSLHHPIHFYLIQIEVAPSCLSSLSHSNRPLPRTVWTRLVPQDWEAFAGLASGTSPSSFKPDEPSHNRPLSRYTIAQDITSLPWNVTSSSPHSSLASVPGSSPCATLHLGQSRRCVSFARYMPMWWWWWWEWFEHVCMWSPVLALPWQGGVSKLELGGSCLLVETEFIPVLQIGHDGGVGTCPLLGTFFPLLGFSSAWDSWHDFCALRWSLIVRTRKNALWLLCGRNLCRLFSLRCIDGGWEIGWTDHYKLTGLFAGNCGLTTAFEMKVIEGMGSHSSQMNPDPESLPLSYPRALRENLSAF